MVPTRLTVFHFTDPHARIAPQEQRAPGMGVGVPSGVPPERILAGLAGIGALMTEELARTDGPRLLICCGDAFGTEVAHDRETEGKVTVEAFATLAARARHDDGIALWTLGNHDVDHGLDRLLALAPDSGMRLVGGNTSVDGAPLSDAVDVIDVGGIRIAVVSLTTVEVERDARTADAARLETTPPVEAATNSLTEAIARRDAGDVDLVLVIAHCHDRVDAVLADAGPDLVIGGHTHAFLGGALGASWRGKAGSHGRALGRVVLRPTPGGRWRVDDAASGLLLPHASLQPDAALLDLAARAEASGRTPEGERQICPGTHAIPGLWTVRSWTRSPVGNAVANGLLDAARALRPDVACALVNAGNIRAELVPYGGAFRRRSFADVLPYGNHLVLVEATPALLRTTLANAVACLKLAQAGWLRVAGLSARIGPQGSLDDIRVGVDDPVPLDSLDTVRFVTLDWIASQGGNHYGFLSAAPQEDLGDAVTLWTDAVAQLADPSVDVTLRGGLEVDRDFRGADPADVVATLHPLAPGALAWARSHLAGAPS